MRSAMSNCLTNMQIALMVTGNGSLALRRALSEHLLSCDDCRQLLAAAVFAEREGSSSVGIETDRGPSTVQVDATVMCEILDKIVPLTDTASERSPVRQIIPLVEMSHAISDEAPVLAARPDRGESTDLPVLASPDRQIVVRFRQPKPDGPFVAYVIKKGKHHAGRVHLAFPSVGISLPVGEEGEVELPGIDKAELHHGRIELELTPLRRPEDPDAPART